MSLGLTAGDLFQLSLGSFMLLIVAVGIVSECYRHFRRWRFERAARREVD